MPKAPIADEIPFQMWAEPTNDHVPRSMFRDAVTSQLGPREAREWTISGVSESQALSEPILNGPVRDLYMNVSWISSSRSAAA